MNEIDDLCINTIRALAMDAVEKAKSGHPGMPMGAAPMAYVLWTQFLRHNPKNPHWHNRDRFVLSAGHGSMLLYSLLHLTGYDLSLEEIKRFRQFGSKTPGHPEAHMVPGIETTTGPLGQGFANGVGLAIGEKFLGARYNRQSFEIVNYHIYAIVSDGDLMEGISSEAASLAGHLKLGNLIYLYDDNHISIDGSTDLAFTEDSAKRFEAYGWHVQKIEDGNDLTAIANAIRNAKEVTDRPSFIKVRTHIAYGSPNKQDTAEAHGAPLGEDEVKLTKKTLGWDPEKQFYIPEEGLKHFRKSIERGEQAEAEWRQLFGEYRKAYPGLAREWEEFRSERLPENWKKALPTFSPEDGGMATRQASGKVLSAIAPHLPTLIGGSADLTPSNNTYVKGYNEFSAGNSAGRYLHFGVREHAMGGILNGLAHTRGIIPYSGTFLIFSDYMRPTIRLAAMMGIRPIYVFTHDSIGLGEDGPTHQPIEHLMSLRAIPNLTVIRPADANETVQAWKFAIEHKGGPVAIILTRQKLPVIDQKVYTSAENLLKGAYVLAPKIMGKSAAGTKKPDIIIIATGSEVQLALKAREQLGKEKIEAQVVSMPSWELFEQQPKEYRGSVFPPSLKKRLAIEAGSPLGWYKYVGDEGDILGVDKFGASAPGEVVMREYGFTVDNVVRRSKAILNESVPAQ
jgi:transketolase